MLLLLLIFKTIYFLLPAYIANMAPVIAARLNLIPNLDIPVDRGYTFRGQRLIGATKTWRGLIVGVATAMFVGTIQYWMWEFNIVRSVSVIDFAVVDPLVFGFIGGVGALGGDLVKSIIKRRFNITSGKPWPVFDQLDFIFGYLILTSFIVGFHPDIFITALIITLFLHPMVNILAYWLKMKNVWW